MLAGERKMVFLPSDGATEDQDVPKGGRADHHRGVRTVSDVEIARVRRGPW